MKDDLSYIEGKKYDWIQIFDPHCMCICVYVYIYIYIYIYIYMALQVQETAP